VISETVLIAASAWTDALDTRRVSGSSPRDLSAVAVAEAISRGVEADDRFQADRFAIDAVDGDVRAVLDSLDFDARMRRARAVVVAAGHLDHVVLRGSAAFEIATRARQGGVPAYAIAGRDTLDPFEARMLDLQQILQAVDATALAAAGRALARLI
jgi:hypothetical protein